VDAAGDVRVIAQQPHGVHRPGTGRHQSRRPHHAFRERTQDGRIDRVIHPEVVGVDDEQAGLCGVPEQFVNPKM